MNTLITGASSGIGEALALASARRGDRLFICGRDKERLSKVAERCRMLGASVRADVLDVADETATRNWIESCNAEAAHRYMALPHRPGGYWGVSSEDNLTAFEREVQNALSGKYPDVAGKIAATQEYRKWVSNHPGERKI